VINQDGRAIQEGERRHMVETRENAQNAYA
jgi:hypothetical protein